MIKELETLIPRDGLSNGGKIDGKYRQKFLELLRENPEIISEKSFLFTDDNGCRREGTVEGFNIENSCIKLFLNVKSKLEEINGRKEMAFNSVLSNIIIGNYGIEFRNFRDTLRIDI